MFVMVIYGGYDFCYRVVDVIDCSWVGEDGVVGDRLDMWWC